MTPAPREAVKKETRAALKAHREAVLAKSDLTGLTGPRAVALVCEHLTKLSQAVALLIDCELKRSKS